MREKKKTVSRKIEKFVTDYDVPLLRLLYYTPWLRWGLLCMVLILVTLPLALVKVWTVTPVDFNPAVKISLLDKLQSWSLRRAAYKAMDAGRFDDAVHAWHSSIANDPGNQIYQREYFQFLMNEDLQKSKSRQAVQNGWWYLKLNQTNEFSLEMVTDVFDFYQLHDINQWFLSQQEENLTPEMEVKYLKSAFHMGNISGFRRGIERLDPVRMEAEPELKLYHAAYMSIWGSPESAMSFVELLRSHFKHPTLGSLAHTLNCEISVARGETDSFKQSMDFMIARGVDRLVHHLQYWTMLVEQGAKDQAIEQFRRYNLPPEQTLDVVRFADFAVMIGEKDLAIQYLKTYATDFGYYEPIWIAYANILIDQRDWQSLNNLAVQARRHPLASGTLEGYTYYMEGRAALGEQKVELAARMMKKVARVEYEIVSVGFYIAQELGTLGFESEALSILRGCSDEMKEQKAYWERVFPLASNQGDSELFLEAARQLYRLEPDNDIYRNNYAALLLSHRQESDTAVRLTWEQLNESSTSRLITPSKYQAALINHALALALNHRFDEAVEHLKQVPAESLDPDFVSGYHLAWFEVAMRKQDYDVARSHGLLVQRDQLLPADREWFETTWDRFLVEN